MRKPVSLCRIQFLILAIAFCASACDVHHYPNFKGRELKPGDPDYPPLNPHPTHVVQFTAVMPPSISTEFILRYEVAYVTRNNKDGSLLALEGPPGCRWKPTDEFSVELPLKMAKQSGDTYQGGFAVDHFQAGKCGWHFTDMVSPILRAPAVLYRDRFNAGDQGDNKIDLWCTHKRKVAPKQPATRDDENQVIDCAPLTMMGGYIDLPDGFYASIPENQRANGRALIAGHARSITVELHDIDAAIAGYAQNR